VLDDYTVGPVLKIFGVRTEYLEVYEQQLAPVKGT
jgi:hypothetical protein